MDIVRNASNPDVDITSSTRSDPSDPENVMPAPIRITTQATGRIAELIAEEGDPALKLRVFVQGGGCSGFQYGFTFDDVTNDDDTVIECADAAQSGFGVAVSLLVDPMSLQYLVGAEIDYQDDLRGAQFVIRNPNAVTTCGCGSSFST
jgi:iron-sulfur cluster insertion protein